jgi:GTPase SAR1 family protein
MRIGISGSINVGKTTLVNDFLRAWPNYKTPDSSYRDLLKSGNYPHSKNCNKEGQWGILNHMIDEMQKYSKNDNVIFDRNPLDCLVFTLWAAEMETSDIDKTFVNKMIPIVKESLKNLDLILFIPITQHSPVEIVDNGKRETDPQYIGEIDNIFKALVYEYQHSLGKTPFFSADDCPAIIEVFGKQEERILLIRQYLDENGNVYGEEDDTILNPENIEDLERLIAQQVTEDEKEKKIKEQERMIREFAKKTKLS